MPAKRNIVKFAKDIVIIGTVAQVTEAAINNFVDEPSENQETGIRIASLFVGIEVSSRLQHRTDAIVDSIADWRKNRKLAQTVAE